jgi:hypothetical protein
MSKTHIPKKKRTKKYSKKTTRTSGKGELIIPDDGPDKKLDLEVINAAKDYFKKDMLANGPEGVDSSAVVLQEDGTAELDDNQMPVFKDSMEWTTSNPQLRAIWESGKALLEEGLVPPPEVDAVMGMMGMIAKKEKPGHTGHFTAEMPINYFVGMTHILNMCRSFDLFKDDKAMGAAIDELTLDFARRIDAYHSIKHKEKVMEETKPAEGFKKGLTLVEDNGYF